MGWGSGGWGTSGWGVPGLGAGLQLVDARAVRENVVRLQFNQSIYFSGLLDPHDGSSAPRYAITPVAGSLGGDGLPTRPVAAAMVALALFAGAGGMYVDLTTDRPFSPWPGQYTVAVNQLVTAVGGALLQPGATSVVFPALYRGRVPHKPDLVTGRTDFANPQVAGALDGLPSTTPLGSFVVDATGDYAADAGLVSFKKRVMRRLMTKKGRFAHLPNYGVGIPDNIKQLARAGVREAIAADAEAQIKLEPETLACSVTVVPDAANPGLLRLQVRVQTRDGGLVAMTVPILVSA